MHLGEGGKPVAYNILIVDDSQTMRKVIRKAVVLSGFQMGECWEAGEGREALALLQSQAVDLILTDFNMPGMTGLEMIRELKKDEKKGRIPVVMITTQSNEWVVQEGKSLGIEGFIQKPFRPETIRDLLNQLMEKSHG
jgi:two-component system, chemotaxis family, chemotaxis protein CheY